MSTQTLTARIHAMRFEADGIVSVEFQPATEQVLFPSFEPGSHIDLHLPNGLVRNYSLCNPHTDQQRYVVAVCMIAKAVADRAMCTSSYGWVRPLKFRRHAITSP